MHDQINLWPSTKGSLDVSYDWNYKRLRPCPSSVVFIHGCHPWIASIDDTSIHGWHFSIHGWHPWMAFLHPWMTLLHPWMTFLHPWMAFSSVWFLVKIASIIFSNVIHGLRSVIHGWKCHPWMPSMDDIHGWRRRMTDTDAAIISTYLQRVW